VTCATPPDGPIGGGSMGYRGGGSYTP
jgi:hypothetical protein